MSFVLGACAGQTTDSADAGTEDRGPLGKADHIGSCFDGTDDDHCGGKSEGNCWCDELCESFGDCCTDYEDACVDDSDDDVCGEVVCALFCENGFKQDENGCDVCECKEQECGGFLGLPCPDGFECVDFPGDSCDPQNGGADCGGICVPAPSAPSCEGNCGGAAEGNACWCDDLCESFGDCCDDFADECTDPGTPCGDEEVCASGEVCVTKVTQVGLVFSCADVPDECTDDVSCDCMGDQVCTGVFNACSEGDDGGLSCGCPVC